MAQLSRAIKRAFLQACPPRLRSELLNSCPNLRKAAPEGLCFVYPDYYSGIAVNIDTRYKVERIMWSGRYEPPPSAPFWNRATPPAGFASISARTSGPLRWCWPSAADRRGVSMPSSPGPRIWLVCARTSS